MQHIIRDLALAKRYLCTLLVLVSTLSFAATPVTVNSASISYTANTITVTGQGFCAGGTLPSVVFAKVALTVTTSPCADTSVVATLPVQAQGSYSLTVTNGSGGSAAFDVTYGAVGPQGPQGFTGATGATRAKGATGATGATGPQGPKGTTGATGEKGLTGATGAIGPQGPVGLTGATGAEGATGSQGPIGLTGAVGPAGAAGATGLTGATGAQGPIGLTGATGATGTTGAAGPQGPAGTNGTGFNFRNAFDPTATYVINDVVTYSGSTYLASVANGPNTLTPDANTSAWVVVAQQGATGSAGSQGLTGAMGPQGSQGIQGLTGAIGPQGAQGLKGDTGAQGSQGIAGPAGTTGTAGTGFTFRNAFDPNAVYAVNDVVTYNGSTYVANTVNGPNTLTPDTNTSAWTVMAAAGAPGAAGADGAVGPVGPIGAVGPFGPQGLQGPKGDTGSTGATGVAGAVGAQGIQGLTGVAGPTGATGAASTVPGPIGPAGPAGTNGTNGSNGTPGTNGTSFNFRGVFNPSNAYALNDVVTFTPTLITYNVNLTFGSAGSAVGTITTDGTQGVLSTSNIVNWSLKLADSATNSTILTPGNSAFSSGNYNTGGQPNSDFSATPTNLTFTYANAGSWSVGGASGSLCITNWSNCFYPGSNNYGTFGINGDGLPTYSSYAGSSQVIATGGAVSTGSTSTYIAKGLVAAGTAIPGTAPWVMMAQAGTNGAVGATGPQGIEGLTGLTGLTGSTGPAGPTGSTGATGAAGAAGPTGGVASYVFQSAQSSLPSSGTATIQSIILPNAGTYMLLGEVQVANQTPNNIAPYCVYKDTEGAAIVLPGSNGENGAGFSMVPFTGNWYPTVTFPVNSAITTTAAGDVLNLNCSYVSWNFGTGAGSSTAVLTFSTMTAIQVK